MSAMFDVLKNVALRDHPGQMTPFTDLIGRKKAIGLYFSASWCPPCRRFTPVLAQFYHQLKAHNPEELEIILVSSDQQHEAFLQYYATMPWLALVFGDTAKAQLSAAAGVSGIPHLCVISGSTGELICANAVNEVSSGNLNFLSQALGY